MYLIIDVYSSAKLSENSGIVRVTRRLSRELQSLVDNIVFVVWDEDTNQYVLPSKKEYEQLSKFNGPILGDKQATETTPLLSLLPEFKSKPIWLFFPEIILAKYRKKAIHFAKNYGIYTAAIFYDAIPILYPELCNQPIRNTHSKYMLDLIELDLVLPISQFSADCLRIYWEEMGISTTLNTGISTTLNDRMDRLNDRRERFVIPIWLPGQFGNSSKSMETLNANQKTINILCVSTLEPRKNHKNLINAFLKMQESHPDLHCFLTLVGNSYNGSPEIAGYVKSICKVYSNIQWLGIVEDNVLEKLYLNSDFTVYPSYIEGYGLPIMESLWKGRPCICHNKGVMAELAKEGGCLMVDVNDVISLSDAIYQLASNKNLRFELSKEAVCRDIKTWKEYAQTLISILLSFT
ncbi:MAG: glycosyltransferase [Leptospiraceae bacterium]|nr:glycosyltransferase [Leptospiraceae bacterium]MCP5495764.1 glycosyltransferase [Leptospiraceae bacterium]